MVIMFKSKKLPRPGELQLRILQALWERGEAGVRELHAVVEPGRRLAYTTIASMLRKMEGRGFVTHREDGRAFIYKAAVAAEEVSRNAGDHFVERLFEGSLANAVSHLLQTREVSREELSQIEKMVKEAKRRAK
jgi:BlaI family penicillinase repressor